MTDRVGIWTLLCAARPRMKSARSGRVSVLVSHQLASMGERGGVEGEASEIRMTSEHASAT